MAPWHWVILISLFGIFMNHSIKVPIQLLMLLGGFVLMACQQDSLPATKENACKQLSAGQAGQQIVSIYRTAIAQTTLLVQNQPAAKVIERQFDQQLVTWQQQLLQIGQHVYAMNETQKKQVESAIIKEHMYMQTNPEAKQQFKSFSQSIYPYHESAPEFYQKLNAINIITQFAFFDLLKQQNKDAELKWSEVMIPFKCTP